MHDLARVTVMVMFALFSFCAQASPWMRSQGESQMAAGAGLSRSDSYWDSGSHELDRACAYKDFSAYAHYEYGYSYYHTLFGEVRGSSSRCGSDESSGLDNVVLGARGRLNVYRNGRTWQLALVLPLRSSFVSSDKNAGANFGLEGGLYFRFLPDAYADPYTSPPRGVWEWAVGTNIWTGRAANELWSYVRWDREMLDRQWRFSAKLHALTAYDGGEVGVLNGSGPNNTYRYDELRGELGLSRRLTENSRISFSYTHDLWGRNIGRDRGIHAGVSWQWD